MRATTVLGFDSVRELPWHILFLLGGGYAISIAWQHSGLSVVMARSVLVLGGGASGGDALGNLTVGAAHVHGDDAAADGGGSSVASAVAVGVATSVLAVALSNIVRAVVSARAVRRGFRILVETAGTCDSSGARHV
jgi:hypothetical protein